MSVAERAFRDTLGRFASGVCVVTARTADGEPIGITITSFTSVSLRPPLVLFCIGSGSSNADVWRTISAFAVNVLSETQAGVSETFASQQGDKFDRVRWHPGDNGAPAIAGCVGRIECTVEAVYPGGDHAIVVGRVERTVLSGLDAPLVRFCGRYHRLGPAVPNG